MNKKEILSLGTDITLKVQFNKATNWGLLVRVGGGRLLADFSIVYHYVNKIVF